MPTYTRDSGLTSEELSQDPEVLAAHDADTLTHSLVTARWFTESRAAQAAAISSVDCLDIPSLWLVGGADTIADVSITQAAFARAGGDKTLHVYEGLHHEVLNELDREPVLADLESWLLDRFPG